MEQRCNVACSLLTSHSLLVQLPLAFLLLVALLVMLTLLPVSSYLVHSTTALALAVLLAATLRAIVVHGAQLVDSPRLCPDSVLRGPPPSLADLLMPSWLQAALWGGKALPATASSSSLLGPAGIAVMP